MSILGNNNQSQEHPWAKKQKQGKWRYIIYNGVLGWGLSVAMLISILDFFWETSSKPFWVNFIMYPFAGIFFGLIMWNSMEKKYKIYLEQQENGLSMNDKLTSNEQPIVELVGLVVYEAFVNKAGRLIEGVGDYFLEIDGKRFFIKFRSGKVLRTAIEAKLGQIIKAKGYLDKGLWDTDDPNVQSRVGEYVVLVELLE